MPSNLTPDYTVLLRACGLIYCRVECSYQGQGKKYG